MDAPLLVNRRIPIVTDSVLVDVSFEISAVSTGLRARSRRLSLQQEIEFIIVLAGDGSIAQPSLRPVRKYDALRREGEDREGVEGAPRPAERQGRRSVFQIRRHDGVHAHASAVRQLRVDGPMLSGRRARWTSQDRARDTRGMWYMWAGYYP